MDHMHLYMSVDDRCGPPYTVVFDDDYEKLCPWANVMRSGREWPDELTDAAVELFESEKNNREQRRKKREKKQGYGKRKNSWSRINLKESCLMAAIPRCWSLSRNIFF